MFLFVTFYKVNTLVDTFTLHFQSGLLLVTKQFFVTALQRCYCMCTYTTVINTHVTHTSKVLNVEVG